MNLAVTHDERLGRLEERTAGLRDDLNCEVETRVKGEDRMDQRQREIEKTIWKASGMATAAAVIAPILMKVFHIL